jgi:hypothetical protein
MKNTDLRAKARAIFGPAIAEPMPKQPNGAKALQQRANARPIPTYKVGGVVKKPMPAASAASGNRMAKQEADEMRFMDMMDKKKKSAMPSPAASAASGNRMAREEGAEMRKMKMAKGGKAGKYADGGMAEEIIVQGRRPQTIDVDLNRMQGTTGGRMGPPAPSSGGGGGRGAAPMMEEPAPPPRSGIRLGTTNRYTGLTAPVGTGRVTFGIGDKVGDSRRVGLGYLQPFKKGGKVQTSSDTARKLATEMGGMKKGGKVKQVDIDMKMLEEASRPRASLPNLESKVAEARNLNTVRAKETSDATKKQSFKEAFAEARRDQGANGVFTWRGNTYNTKMAGETSKAAPARAAAPAPTRATPPAAVTPPARAATPTPTPTPTPPAATANKSSNAGSSMSSVARNLDTRSSMDAGALEARAKKIMAESGGSLFSSPKNIQQAREIARAEDEDRRNMSRYRGEQERKKKSLDAGRKANPDLVSRFVDMTMNPGYKKGGKVKEPKPKNGLAVMIAIGKPMKPAKKMNGGPMAERSTDMESSKVTREMAMGGAPMGYAAGGAGKTRKGQAPIKKAQGGAAKVRKGMMTPEGDIINVMNKMRGK